MFIDELKKFFWEEGYQYLPSNLPEFHFFYCIENRFVAENSFANVFLVIDHEKNRYISADQHVHIKKTAENLFRSRGIQHVHIMTLMISSMTEMQRTLFCDSFSWWICPTERTLDIPEGQVQDFYGIRRKLEEWLCCLPESLETIETETEIKEIRIQNKKRKQKKQPISAVMHKDRPYATTAFVVFNILVYVICTFTGDLLYNIGVFHAESVWKEKEYYRWITSIFLHWDIYHLTSNMLILYYLGSVVEKYFGHLPFVLTYFFSGISGNLASFLYENFFSMNIYSAGASGSVFGIMGALLVLTFLTKGRWKEITYGRVFFMISYTLYNGMVSDHINNAAHMGGLAGGILMMSVIQIFRYMMNKKLRNRKL